MLVAAVSVLLLYGSIGMLLAVAFAAPPTGPGFWRLTLLLIVAGGGLGIGLRIVVPAGPVPGPGTAAVIAAVACLGASAALGIAQSVSGDGSHRGLLGLAALLGAVTLALDPALRASSTSTPFEQGVFVLGLASVGLALGSVLAAMVLAHWYLIEPRMPLAPLNRVLTLFLGTEGLKAVLLVAAIGIHLPEWLAADGGLMRSFVLGDALFVGVRATLGVLAPIGLGIMTWKTVQIRSIQSATGILYAAIVFVLFGEVISVYLSLSTGRPF